MNPSSSDSGYVDTFNLNDIFIFALVFVALKRSDTREGSMAELSSGWTSIKRHTRTILEAIFSPILSYRAARHTKRQKGSDRNIGGSRHFHREKPPIIQVFFSQRSLLSIPSSKDQKLLMNPQHQYNLNSGLPLEIRQLIWHFYAGGMKLHLGERENDEGARLFATLCISNHYCPEAQIWGTWNGFEFEGIGKKEQRPENTRLYIVPSLLTCRQMLVLPGGEGL